MPRHLTTGDLQTSEVVLPSQVGVANGVAALDNTGKVPLAQLPTIATGTVTSVNGHTGVVSLVASDVGAVGTSQVGIANGVAGLDNTGHLPIGQLPSGFLTTANVNVANGIAGTDANNKVPMAQLYTNVANGVPQLDGTGTIQAAQALIKSVNSKTGTVVLSASDVSAVASSAVGAASGVASLNSSSKVPLTQLPDLSSLYVPVPAATPTAAGQLYTSNGSGSNSASWTSPLIYTATSSAGRPVSPPTGSLVTQTDTDATWVWGGSQWFRTNTDISVPRYASDAAVTADFPSPANGQLIFRTDIGYGLMMRYVSALSAWRPVAGESLIAETTLGSAGTITFSSIPAYFRDLKVMWSARSDQSTDQNVQIRVNGASTASYDQQLLNSGGTTTASTSATNQTSAQIGIIPSTGFAGGIYTVGELVLADYQSSKDPSWQGKASYGDNATMHILNSFGVYKAAGAVTSMTIFPATGNFSATSKFALYGVA